MTPLTLWLQRDKEVARLLRLNETVFAQVGSEHLSMIWLFPRRPIPTLQS